MIVTRSHQDIIVTETGKLSQKLSRKQLLFEWGGSGGRLGSDYGQPVPVSGGDLDLFVEVITASESHRYLQRVYEGYATYERLYRRSDLEGQQ